MKIINMVCPNCGASLQVDADKNNLTCNYCGSNLLLDDGVQHIQYDNAEAAGYQFERGRQRAQAEARISPDRQQATINPNKAQKKSKTWLWVLGWIFIFPVPLTILMLRNKKLNKMIKYGIIAVAWIIYLIIALAGRGVKDNSSTSQNVGDNTSSVVHESDNKSTTRVEQETTKVESTTENTSSFTETELQQDASDIIENSNPNPATQAGAIDYFVEEFNASSDNKLTFAEDFVVSSKESGHYRTEFRLGAYEDAVGKSYNYYNDKIVDIVATKSYFGKIDIRIYSDGITLAHCLELIRYASPLLDTTISNETVNEAIDYVTENKEANGYYYGELGLLILGNDKKGYDIMIKTD